MHVAGCVLWYCYIFKGHNELRQCFYRKATTFIIILDDNLHNKLSYIIVPTAYALGSQSAEQGRFCQDLVEAAPGQTHQFGVAFGCAWGRKEACGLGTDTWGSSDQLG